MKYKCKNNHTTSITYSDFKQGYRCAKCSGTQKYTYKYVKEKFAEHDCELLDTAYMNYKCHCGNKSRISFSNFQQGSRCMKCSGNERLTYDFVKKYFTPMKI
jgi:hypothetical protein